MTTVDIPFNRPFVAGKELLYVAESVMGGHSSGDGPFSKRCQALLEEILGVEHVLLTTSCSAAIDIASLVCDIGEGDEVIAPTFTAPGTVNAFVHRGARIVFCDIRPDTFTIDLESAAAAVTERTRAIVPRHYAGVCPDLDRLMAMAATNELWVIEDAAEALNAKYQDSVLGTVGHVGALSFHETKDLSCGEGGAFVTSDERLHERAEIIREKGTNRSQFFRGQVDKYTWVDIGSSYVPADILAAYLYAQLENLESVMSRRQELYELYRTSLQPLHELGQLELPTVPDVCRSNFHRFHVLLRTREQRDMLIGYLATRSIMAVRHFHPLHLSEMGMKLGWVPGQFPVAEDIAGRILRLPFYTDLTHVDVSRVCSAIGDFFAADRTS